MIELKNFQNCKHPLGKRRLVSETRKGKTYRIVNELELDIEKWEPDECLFPNETACDFLFLLTDGKHIKKAHWVELKGSDVNKAACQILETIQKVKLEKGFIPHARIIPSKNPSLEFRDTDYRNLIDYINQYGGTVINKNRLLEDIIKK